MFTVEPPLPGATSALLQQRREPRHGDAAALSQAPPRAVRRVRSRSSRFGWFIRAVLAIPLASQTPGDADAAAARGRRPAGRGQHLLRGRLRRRASARQAAATRRCSSTSPTTPGSATRSPPSSTCRSRAMRALETGRPLLRATNTGITAAIDHRRPRARAAAVVHARHPRSRGRRPHGHDAVRALGRRGALASRRARRFAGLRRGRACRGSRRAIGYAAAEVAGKMRSAVNRAARPTASRCSPFSNSS